VASLIKRRRASQDEVTARRFALYQIVAAMHPMTVRQVFYQATVRGIVEKTEAGYSRVQTDLVWMRRNSFWVFGPSLNPGWDGANIVRLPYDWLTDSTRWQRKPRSFSDPRQALLEPPSSIARRFGPRSARMSRSGSKRMRSPVSCT